MTTTVNKILLGQLIKENNLPAIKLMYADNPKVSEYIIEYYNISLEILQWYHKNVKKLPDDIILQLTHCGNLETIIWLIENGYHSSNEDIINRAAENGHLNIIKYFHNDKDVSAKYAVDNAAAGGDLETVMWLIENGYPYCEKTTMLSAVEYGNLQIIKYLCAIGNTFIEKAMNVAAEYGYLDIVQYFVSIGHNHCSIDMAVLSDETEVVEWIIENGVKYDFTVDAISWVAQKNNRKLIKLFYNILGEFDHNLWEAIDLSLQYEVDDGYTYLLSLIHEHMGRKWILENTINHKSIQRNFY